MAVKLNAASEKICNENANSVHERKRTAKKLCESELSHSSQMHLRRQQLRNLYSLRKTKKGSGDIEDDGSNSNGSWRRGE